MSLREELHSVIDSIPDDKLGEAIHHFRKFSAPSTYKKGDWKQAIGAVPWRKGQLTAAERIRRGRDAKR